MLIKEYQEKTGKLNNLNKFGSLKYLYYLCIRKIIDIWNDEINYEIYKESDIVYMAITSALISYTIYRIFSNDV